MELVDNGIVALTPGARVAHLQDVLARTALRGGSAVAFVITAPVNRWMIGRGDVHHSEEPGSGRIGLGPVSSTVMCRILGVPLCGRSGHDEYRARGSHAGGIQAGGGGFRPGGAGQAGRARRGGGIRLRGDQ
ncbi:MULTISPECIES: DUF4396 domain-containing protein [unclassified Streptomyces]|uniref:DUF4396 domain-containing protein n=1 Tax=unclassified Streptomyces TaxID=2593676 RepID=UPI0033AA91F5